MLMVVIVVGAILEVGITWHKPLEPYYTQFFRPAVAKVQDAGSRRFIGNQGAYGRLRQNMFPYLSQTSQLTSI